MCERLAAEGYVAVAPDVYHRFRDGTGDWEHGRVMAVTHRPGTGVFEAAASPRLAVAYAIALP